MDGIAETKMGEEEDSDVRLLREMGYQQELYRGFSPLMSFAFCFTAVNILASLSSSFSYALNTGGSGVTIWSWIIGSVCTILIGLSLAEICSVYPSAGSVYHWYKILFIIPASLLMRPFSFICFFFGKGLVNLYPQNMHHYPHSFVVGSIS